MNAWPLIAILFHVQHGLQVHALLIGLGKRVLVGLQCLIDIWPIICILAWACSGRLFRMRHLNAWIFACCRCQSLRCRSQLRVRNESAPLRLLASFLQVLSKK